MSAAAWIPPLRLIYNVCVRACVWVHACACVCMRVCVCVCLQDAVKSFCESSSHLSLSSDGLRSGAAALSPTRVSWDRGIGLSALKLRGAFSPSPPSPALSSPLLPLLSLLHFIGRGGGRGRG